MNKLKSFFEKAFKMVDAKRVGEAIGAIALGILGGLVAASIINYLAGRSICPVCKKDIHREIRRCPHCGTYLEWD